MEVQEIPEDYPLYAYKTGALNDEQASQHFGTLRCQVSLSGFLKHIGFAALVHTPKAEIQAR